MEIETARRLWARACESHGVERTMPRTGQMLAAFGSLVETAERERWLKAAAAALEGPCAAVECPEDIEFVAKGMERLREYGDLRGNASPLPEHGWD